MSGSQQTALKNHLYPGDEKEAVANALCGRRAGLRRHRLLVRSLHFVQHDQCIERSETSVTWPTDIMAPWLEEAARRGFSVVNFHNHPGWYRQFSPQDDLSDGPLFKSVAGWMEADVPHASVTMLPEGQMFGRGYVDEHFVPLSTVMVAGDDLLIWHADGSEVASAEAPPAFSRRHAQAFGASTTLRLSRLSAAVIGCQVQEALL